jgi:hypothetical protein
VPLPLVWGATDDETRRTYSADGLLEGPQVSMTRAVTVLAPPDVTWRWVCQLSVAPYSYDWVDNLGRRSPRELTPGAEELQVGRRMMSIFELVSVDPGRQWTGVVRGRRPTMLFGPVAVTYAVEPDGAGSRLVCRIAVAARSRLARLRVRALAWGDLVMMRKQLLNLKELAERS